MTAGPRRVARRHMPDPVQSCVPATGSRSRLYESRGRAVLFTRGGGLASYPGCEALDRTSPAAGLGVACA